MVDHTGDEYDEPSTSAMRPSSPGRRAAPRSLEYATCPTPRPARARCLIDVAATAVNRADLLQRQGFYPPPPGASDVHRAGVQRHRGGGRARASTGCAVGDQVCALLAGGGYATRVAVPAGQVMPVPEGVDLVTAAALPEVAGTVWSNVIMVAGLRPGDVLLVHGGAGGIGTLRDPARARRSARGC